MSGCSVTFLLCLLYKSIIIGFTIWQSKSPQILEVITFSDFFFPNCSCWVHSSRWILELCCQGSWIGSFYWNFLYNITKLSITKCLGTTHSADLGVPLWPLVQLSRVLYVFVKFIPKYCFCLFVFFGEVSFPIFKI